MIHPMLCGILCKWKLPDAIFVDIVTEMEEDAEGCLSKKSVCGVGNNMEAGKVLCRIGQSV
jgi:hypothetical protein